MSKMVIKLKSAEQGMINRVVSRFLLERRATPRRELVIDFREVDLLDSLVQRSILRDLNREKYLPSLMSFYFYDDPETVYRVRNCFEITLHTLKELFLTSDEGMQFGVEDVENKARELGRALGNDTIALGLYLAQEFGVLGTYQRNAEQTEVVLITVTEQILRLKNIEGVWDTAIEQRSGWLRSQLGMDASHDSTDIEPSEMFNTDEPSRVVDSKVMIFISHSSKDESIALALVELLNAALRVPHETIRCTSVDGYRLPVGAQTDQVLKLEVRESKAFIGLITPNSMHSAYVLFELGARWGAELHLMPVLAGVGAAALAGPLKAINSVSASSDAQLHQLIGDIGEVLQLPVQSPVSYTRYLNKVMQEVQRSFSTFVNMNLLSNPPDLAGERSGKRKIDSLTRESVSSVARGFVWSKQLPKWTVIVDGRELPVRPLVLRAVGALPNDSTTSNSATAKLKALGFEVRYQGERDA
jgi:hypothetical protein